MSNCLNRGVVLTISTSATGYRKVIPIATSETIALHPDFSGRTSITSRLGYTKNFPSLIIR